MLVIGDKFRVMQTVLYVLTQTGLDVTGERQEIGPCQQGLIQIRHKAFPKRHDHAGTPARQRLVDVIAKLRIDLFNQLHFINGHSDVAVDTLRFEYFEKKTGWQRLTCGELKLRQRQVVLIVEEPQLQDYADLQFSRMIQTALYRLATQQS